ncbi:MAG: sulfur carrier protein ThiS [Elusimicrobia bacterium]|nr:sulfur carrier protein ThiS [Elusimicrobiota bacterium]
MKIQVNGDAQTIEKESVTVSELLALNKVQAPEMVSVQLNGKFVEKAQYAATTIADGDEVDFLYFLGGGR